MRVTSGCAVEGPSEGGSGGRGWLAAAVVLLLSVCVLPLGARDAARARTAPSSVDKILVFVLENHSMEQLRAGMPFTAQLAERYGYADNYRAVTHPSLPNYLAIAGGTTAGVTDDRPPASHPVGGETVFGQALRNGRSARVYADGMPALCARDNGGRGYAVRHNPWTYYSSERADCLREDVRIGRLAGDIRAGRLPNVGMVVPNVCHDAHDCSLAVADQWFEKQLSRVLAGPDWASGHLTVVVTADEDDFKHDNEVLTSVLSPSLQGVVVHTPLTHYSLSRALSEVAGARPLGEAAGAPSLLEAFGLRATQG